MKSEKWRKTEFYNMHILLIIFTLESDWDNCHCQLSQSYPYHLVTSRGLLRRNNTSFIYISRYDVVTVYDGQQDTDTVIGEFCGSEVIDMLLNNWVSLDVYKKNDMLELIKIWWEQKWNIKVVFPSCCMLFSQLFSHYWTCWIIFCISIFIQSFTVQTSTYFCYWWPSQFLCSSLYFHFKAACGTSRLLVHMKLLSLLWSKDTI